MPQQNSAPEARTNRNLAREQLDAALSQDGANLGGVRGLNGVEITFRMNITPPIRVRPNNPKPVTGRPDSTITEVDVYSYTERRSRTTVRFFFRIATPDSTNGGG